MWCFIVCVNLAGQGCDCRAGETSFLSASVVGLLEEISIWFSKLNKEDRPSPIWGDIIQSIEARNTTKRQRRDEFYVSDRAGKPVFSCPRTLALVLRPVGSGMGTAGSSDCQGLRLGLKRTTSFPSPQLADSRLWAVQLLHHVSQSLKANLFLHMYLYISH